MKQLSALGARRHAFFRSPRRMRPLVDRLEPGELIPNGPFSFYGGECAAEWQGAASRGWLRWKRGAVREALLVLERSGEWGRDGEGWGVNQGSVVETEGRIPDGERGRWSGREQLQCLHQASSRLPAPAGGDPPPRVPRVASHVLPAQP